MTPCEEALVDACRIQQDRAYDIFTSKTGHAAYLTILPIEAAANDIGVWVRDG